MRRTVSRAVTGGLACALTTLLTAAPAFADNPIGPSEGADPGKSLGPGMTILLFVVTPIGSCLLIAAAVLLPGVIRANRYRPAEGWAAEPVWFAGPAEPGKALETAQSGDVTRGGASGSW